MVSNSDREQDLAKVCFCGLGTAGFGNAGSNRAAGIAGMRISAGPRNISGKNIGQRSTDNVENRDAVNVAKVNSRSRIHRRVHKLVLRVRLNPALRKKIYEAQ
jgi:hypothetical protein